jgi:predicted dehydrogenase
MRFALLGSHPDGRAFAAALVESGRHTLAACTAPLPTDWRERFGENIRAVADLEEVLADPAVEAVVVAGNAANRALQLRRALQSERHALCVHPPGETPDAAYEAALVRGDTGMILLPLLHDAVHPGIDRLGELLTDQLGTLRLIELEVHGPEPVLLDAERPGHKPSVPGWDVLRRLGGEIAEVSGFASAEELVGDAPLLLSGRFERGGLFRATYLPGASALWRLTVRGAGEAALLFPEGRGGRSVLQWRTTTGEGGEQEWEEFDPWPVLVEAFEATLAAHTRAPEPELVPAGAAWREVRTELQSESITVQPEGITVQPRPTGHAPMPSRTHWRPIWEDAVRSLELDDAARRSVERRRASTLEYPEANEEVGFKGTMTLVGCAVLWVMLLLLILSIWVPVFGRFILPALGVFLVLQVFLFAARRGRG